jgi:phage baseplate assembly protein W
MDQRFQVDLSVVPFMQATDSSQLDLNVRSQPTRRGSGQPPGELADLQLVDGRDNVAQALILRLLTPRGSLAALGHADYGSRLHELIGRNKTVAMRALCRAFVLEAVAQETRVEPRAVAFEFDLDAETPSSLSFTVSVQPRAGGAPIAVSLEVGL